MIDESSFEDYTFTFTILSIISSIFFILILNKNPTSYGRLVVHVVMGEAISLFCILIFILQREKNFFIQNLSRNIFNYLTYNSFVEYSNDKHNNSNNYFENNTAINKIMIKLNVSAYYSTEIFSLFLSVFICLEIILVLKNPLAQMKNRVTSYFAFSYTMATLVFILNFIFKEFNFEDIEDLKKISFDLLYKRIFYSDIGV